MTEEIITCIFIIIVLIYMMIDWKHFLIIVGLIGLGCNLSIVNKNIERTNTLLEQIEIRVVNVQNRF